MVTPNHHARDHHTNYHHARYKRKERRKIVPWPSRPGIMPVTNVYHHHHGRDQGRDRFQELFFFFFSPPPRPWSIFKAWSRPWSMPCLLQCFVLLFKCDLKGVLCYNHPKISIHACIYIVQRSLTNYTYFGGNSMRVLLSKLCLSLEFEYVWCLSFSRPILSLSGVTSLELGIRYSITCLSARLRLKLANT